MFTEQKQKRPIRFFNTTGPCNPWDHYMLPPADRLVGAQLHRYIGDQLYWVLYAPRQTGKTTFLQTWLREINSGDEAVACYVSLERCQKIPDRERAMPEACNAIREYAVLQGLPKPELTTDGPSSMVSNILIDWSKKLAPKPLVILFDETDALEGDAMISFLRQLRGGFMSRGIGKFPVSIALVGMRDLKDYITAAKDGVPPSPLSPFNIKADSVLLSNFSPDEVQKLFTQRTEETGQKITDEALEYTWEQSQGQPWIVNSLFIVNGGGRIEREYAAGRGRMDLAVEYNKHWYIIEIKLIHYYDSPDEICEEGIDQVKKYRNSIDQDAPAYLVIFDRRPEAKERAWAERLTWNTQNDVTIIGA